MFLCLPSVSLLLGSWILLKSPTNVQLFPSMMHLSVGPCGNENGNIFKNDCLYTEMMTINKSWMFVTAFMEREWGKERACMCLYDSGKQRR